MPLLRCRRPDLLWAKCSMSRRSREAIPVRQRRWCASIRWQARRSRRAQPSVLTCRSEELLLFENRGEKAIARMNAGNRAEKFTAHQPANVVPDQVFLLLQTNQFLFHRNKAEFRVGPQARVHDLLVLLWL